MGMIPVALKHRQKGYPEQNGGLFMGKSSWLGNLPAMELIAGGLYSYTVLVVINGDSHFMDISILIMRIPNIQRAVESPN